MKGAGGGNVQVDDIGIDSSPAVPSRTSAGEVLSGAENLTGSVGCSDCCSDCPSDCLVDC